MDDNLLLLGLKSYGTDFQAIQTYFLKNKAIDEIKHRYKNLTAKKSDPNLVKKWKILTFLPLTEDDEVYWKRGLEWFGANNPKFALIKKYFLPERQESFLKEYFFFV